MRHQEKNSFKFNGFFMLFVALLVLAGIIITALLSAVFPLMLVLTILLGLLEIFIIKGFIMIQPNDARVLTFFGKYSGSIKENGFFWINPLAAREHVSLKINNFTSDKIKVNDSDGNPILIAAVIVWRVVDTTKAIFDVDNYEEFVEIQSETAIRSLASKYPYDSHSDDVPSLRGVPEKVAEELRKELQKRMDQAGVEIIEARISHLAYAPEIAQAMLRRQQARAVIMARQQIVDGAMGMVEMALKRLEENGVVQLDEERKAAMVNNLLVALVSESETHPVINTGTLYS